LFCWNTLIPFLCLTPTNQTGGENGRIEFFNSSLGILFPSSPPVPIFDKLVQNSNWVIYNLLRTKYRVKQRDRRIRKKVNYSEYFNNNGKANVDIGKYCRIGRIIIKEESWWGMGEFGGENLGKMKSFRRY
jgi:hypothetical protein